MSCNKLSESSEEPFPSSGSEWVLEEESLSSDEVPVQTEILIMATYPLTLFILTYYTVQAAFTPDLSRPRTSAINKIADVNATCDSSNINITVLMASPFKGLLFTKDFPHECHATETLSYALTLHLPSSGCGIRLNSKMTPDREEFFYETTLVLQQDKFLQQATDLEYTVKCSLHKDDFTVKSKPMMEAVKKIIKQKYNKDVRIGRMKQLSETDFELSQEVLETLTAAKAWMEIIPEQENSHSGTLQVGEPTLLIVKSTLPVGIGWRIVDCTAHDGLGDSSQKLLDERGCPIDELLLATPLMGPPKPIAQMRHQEVVSKFSAFKFPDRDRLHLSCGLQICKGFCEKVNCSCVDGGNDNENRLGRTLSTGDIIDRFEVYNSVEVIAPGIEIDEFRNDNLNKYLNKSKSKWISVGLYYPFEFASVVKIFGRSKQYVIFKEEEWIQFHEQRENINKYFQTFDTMWKPRQIGSKTLTFEMIEEKKILKIENMSGNEVYLGWESVSEVWSLESVLRYRLSYSSGSNFKYFYEDVIRAVAEMSGDMKINIYNIINRLSEKSDDVCCMLEVLLFMPEKALFDVQLDRCIQEQGQKRVKNSRGTIAFVKPNDLFYYLKHKKKFKKSFKRKEYIDAIGEIEEDIKKCGGTDGDSEDIVKKYKPVLTKKVEVNKNFGQKRKLPFLIGDSKQEKAVGKNDEVMSEPSPSTSQQTRVKPLSNVGKHELTVHKCLTISDIKIISEDYLTAIIAYAEFVMKCKSTFKNTAVQIRQKFENQTVLVKLPSGKYVGIKYNTTLPQLNEFDQAMYEANAARTALSLKKLLEDGKCKPNNDNRLIENIEINEGEKIIEYEIIELKKYIISQLHIEAQLVELETKIKACLGLYSADPLKAVRYLEEMLMLNVTSLMLKKHPIVVESVIRLKKYIGNTTAWAFNKEQNQKFDLEAKQVRNKAGLVRNKFSQLYKISDEKEDEEFWDVFYNDLEIFYDQVKDLPETKILALTSEPSKYSKFVPILLIIKLDSRQMFFDNIAS
ncbi:hypothetical protein FQA39_LY07020 [Lamprigera yunnana]|nr:hypothetical protein FQA39_LY07020 [Lamprigera yunnana]